MVVEQVIRMLWGASPLQSSIPGAFKGQLAIGDFFYSRYRLLMLGVVFVALTAIWLLLNKTSFGRVVQIGRAHV